MGIVSQYGLLFYTIGTGLSMDIFIYIHFLFANVTKIPVLIKQHGFIFYSHFLLPHYPSGHRTDIFRSGAEARKASPQK